MEITQPAIGLKDEVAAVAAVVGRLQVILVGEACRWERLGESPLG